MNDSVDLAIVGTGLMGSRTFIELADRVRLAKGPPPALRVALFDKLGEFGKGVPYGARSSRDALLIETLEQTRCPEFAEWLRQNPHELDRLARSDAKPERAWYARNSRAIKARRFEELYLPRHVFGTYSLEALTSALTQAEVTGSVRTIRRNVEVESIERDGRCYRLNTACGSLIARAVVVAVGSIPRGRAAPMPEDVSHRYVHDHEICGVFQLERALSRFVEREPSGPVAVVIVGAGASALESIYGLFRDRGFSARITSVTTLSPSGVLPGGVASAGHDPRFVSSYAQQRTSAAEYVALAGALVTSGRLRTLSAVVRAIEPAKDGKCLVVRATPRSQGENLALRADLVVNCCGAGELPTTTSKLLRSLACRLALGANRRSFVLRDDFTSDGWPNVFVSGPLLNRTGEAHVESISAVFRLAREQSPHVWRALSGDES